MIVATPLKVYRKNIVLLHKFTKFIIQYLQHFPKKDFKLAHFIAPVENREEK